MTKARTIQEAFYRLNERLLSYEDGEFLRQSDIPSVEDSISNIRSVYLDACLFEDAEIKKYADKYFNRIHAIYINLRENVEAFGHEEPIKNLLPECYKELANYLFYIEKLQSLANNENATVIQNDKSRVYELHEKFDLRKVKKEAGFEGKLSAIDAATLLYYLYKAGFSPDYSASTRGRIANALFWISQKNVTESFEGNQHISTEILLIGDFIKLCNEENINSFTLNFTLQHPYILSK